jgi:hypothetical protein
MSKARKYGQTKPQPKPAIKPLPGHEGLRKRPGMLMPDGRQALSVLTVEEQLDVERVDRRRWGKPLAEWIVWQERTAQPHFDASDPRTWHDAVLAMFPRTQLSDGTMGRWLIEEYPDVEYLDRPYPPEHFEPAQATLF